MIKSAREVLFSQDLTEYEKCVQGVMRDIEQASKKGYRDTHFSVRNNSFYEAVKQEFKNNGYTFKPTGYIGGVWQMTEHIHW